MSELYRPGLEGIVAGETAVSTTSGGLRYRGYAIEDLAEHASFEEAAYLILHGKLPTQPQLQDFQQRLSENAQLPPALVDALRLLPRNTPLMDVMRTGASLLAHFDPEAAAGDRGANLRKAERLMAKLPVVLAAAHQLRQGNEPPAPQPGLSLAANLLQMLLGRMPPDHWVKAMDVSLVLYAEHEFNASTFTARVVASTLSDLHSAITAAIGALKGSLHGGANERVLEVLEQIGGAERAEAWVRDALARKEKIMGFGHRVYKDGDPRAEFLKTFCRQLAEETGYQDLESMADTIETVVRQEKRLPPNLDWPSARLYHYMRLPVDLYTPLFVVSRVTGWSAHVIEQLENNRIIRPRSRYTGQPECPWLPIEQRG